MSSSLKALRRIASVLWESFCSYTRIITFICRLMALLLLLHTVITLLLFVAEVGTTTRVNTYVVVVIIVIIIIVVVHILILKVVEPIAVAARRGR